MVSFFFLAAAAATPLGYIASELITNSVKYAKGKITVRLQMTPNGGAVLSVSDDGPGLPESFDPTATSGLGMKIVAALVRQIHGQLKFSKGDHHQGARFSVLFTSQVEIIIHNTLRLIDNASRTWNSR